MIIKKKRQKTICYIKLIIMAFFAIFFLLSFSEHSDKIKKISKYFSVILSNINLKNENKINLWKKYELNPVLGNDKIGTIFDPYVMFDYKGFYRMYVSWRKNGNIAVSLSRNGFKWSNLHIVLDKGNSNWENIINRASIIYRNGFYHMWYTGQKNGKSKIGYAKSKDGYKFKKLKNPVLIPEYSFEKQSVMNPHVIFDQKEKKYKMWYAAGEYIEPDVIGYATSLDGINWKKYKNNPIFTASRNILSLDSFKVGGSMCTKYQIINI